MAFPSTTGLATWDHCMTYVYRSWQASTQKQSHTQPTSHLYVMFQLALTDVTNSQRLQVYHVITVWPSCDCLITYVRTFIPSHAWLQTCWSAWGLGSKESGATGTSQKFCPAGWRSGWQIIWHYVLGLAALLSDVVGSSIASGRKLCNFHWWCNVG